MKKLVLSLAIVGMLVGSACTTQAAEARGGFMGFIAGCCFGVRAGAAYNDGKDIHWREWLTLVPGVSIWNGIEGASGKKTSDYAKQYGASYY
jgi:hypothetical protein